MKRIHSIIAIVLVLITLSVYGCGSTTTIIQQAPNSVYTPPAAPTLTDITVTPSYPSNLTVGYTQQFTATAAYSNGSTADVTSQATWNSGNPNIAAFNSSAGLVTGISAGTVGITATFSGLVSTPITLTVISAPITTVPPVSITTLWSVQDQVFKPSTYDTAPPNGVYAQAGETLTFSWSADGGLVGYIFTENQYNNWKNNLAGLPSSYEGYNSGSTGSITVTIQNSDTYYAVLFNNALGILGSGPNVEVYQATLTEH
jgi:hypothetical protein